MAVKPKYRSLSSDELVELEKEFIEYLVVNGITADEWSNLKANDLPRAEDIITLFSDVVFEGIMRKVRFLERRTKSEIRTFQCLEQKLVMIGLKTGKEDFDLTDPNFIQTATSKPPAGITIFKAEQPYSSIRETELFKMTESGFIISDGRLFKALQLASV